jgi:hypothetical protein
VGLECAAKILFLNFRQSRTLAAQCLCSPETSDIEDALGKFSKLVFTFNPMPNNGDDRPSLLMLFSIKIPANFKLHDIMSLAI